jgi:hypothetical protein
MTTNMSTTTSNLPLTTSSTLDDITRIINQHIEAGHTGIYVIGLLYNEVVEKRLAVIAGYKDTRDYFTQKVKRLSQPTLSVYGRVAKLFTEAACMQHGPFKLNALAAYAEVAALSLPADPSGVVIAVPQDDGKVQEKPFTECSVDEVTRATKAKRAVPKSPVPVADQARLLFLADSIVTQFVGVAPVRMTSRSPGGKTIISLQDVPLAELPRLVAALQAGMTTEPSMRLQPVPMAA